MCLGRGLFDKEPRARVLSLANAPDPTTVTAATIITTTIRYVRYKSLQKQLEFFDIQEEYIKDEMKVPSVHRAVKLRIRSHAATMK